MDKIFFLINRSFIVTKKVLSRVLDKPCVEKVVCLPEILLYAVQLDLEGEL